MLANNIKILRKNMGFTQSDLAKLLHTSASTVGMYEQGRRAPDNKMLKKLSNIFCVSIDNLLGNFNFHKDIKEMIDDITKILKENKGLLFDGRPISYIDKIKLANAIRVAVAVTIAEIQEDVVLEEKLSAAI